MKDDIIRLRALGYSYNEIQKALGCSKGTISYHLGVGQSEKTIQRTRDKRNKIRVYIQEFKDSNPCTDCRERYPYWIMEFDHLGNKTFGIADFRTFTGSLDVVKAEMAKCELVCSNCHSNRTHYRLIKSGGDLPSNLQDRWGN